jgi:hypothetical protein
MENRFTNLFRKCPLLPIVVNDHSRNENIDVKELSFRVIEVFVENIDLGCVG